MVRLMIISCAALVLGLFSCSPAGTAQVRDADTPAAPAQTARPAKQSLTIKGLVKDRALLVRGTEMIQGLPLAVENAVPALYGEYAFGMDAASPDAGAAVPDRPSFDAPVPYALFRVWHTATPVVSGDDWKQAALNGFPAGVKVFLRDLPDTRREVWLYDAPAYRLFLETPAGFEKSAAFLVVFSERFAYYARYAASPNDLSFPAQVDL